MFGPSGVSGKNDFLYIMLIGISRPNLVRQYRVRVRVRVRERGREREGERERERERERNGM